MEITTTSLAHLGLVAGIFDELDIAGIIDLLPINVRFHQKALN